MVKTEGDATGMIHDIVERGTTVYADEAPCSDIVHARYETKRINHSFAFSDEDACTNQAESYLSRLRRGEIGQHHRIGVHLSAYAGEMAWRENNRRKANGTLFQLVAASAAASKPSRQWAGYWQGCSVSLLHGSACHTLINKSLAENDRWQILLTRFARNRLGLMRFWHNNRVRSFSRRSRRDVYFLWPSDRRLFAES